MTETLEKVWVSDGFSPHFKKKGKVLRPSYLGALLVQIDGVEKPVVLLPSQMRPAKGEG